MKKTLMLVLMAVAIATTASAQKNDPKPADDSLTVGQVLDVTNGLTQLVKYETVDKEGKPSTGYYKFSADTRLLIALNIDLGRRLQTQLQNATNDLVMQALDPATGQVLESKRNSLNTETSKMLTVQSRVVLYRIKKDDLKLDDNPIPGPVLSLIVPILDR